MNYEFINHLTVVLALFIIRVIQDDRPGMPTGLALMRVPWNSRCIGFKPFLGCQKEH